MWWEQALILMIVLAAAGYIARSWISTFKKPGCGSCKGGCSSLKTPAAGPSKPCA